MKHWIAALLLVAANSATAEDPQVILRTSYGDITVRLFAD